MKQLLILSGKGGTGKTTVASAFIKISKAKSYADCDVDAPNLHLSMGKEEPSEQSDFFGLDKALIKQDSCVKCGKCKDACRFDAIGIVDGCYEVNKAACEGCAVCALVCPNSAVSMLKSAAGKLMLYKEDDVVFSTAQLNIGSGNSGLLVTEVKKNMQNSAQSDFAIIDGSPGIGCPVIASISGTDLILVVSEPSVSGISDLERIIQTAEVFGVKTAVCINKFDTNQKISDEIEGYCSENGISFVGRIPFDNLAMEAINAGKTVADIDCPSGHAIEEIYSKTYKLLSEED